jgi:hypothetical protein
MPDDVLPYPRCQFLPAMLSHAVWLYYRFSLSFRDVEGLFAARGAKPSALFVSPADWGTLQATKTTAGDYVLSPDVAVGFRSGFSVLYDPYSQSLKDSTVIRARWRCDVMPLDVAALELIAITPVGRAADSSGPTDGGGSSGSASTRRTSTAWHQRRGTLRRVSVPPSASVRRDRTRSAPDSAMRCACRKGST